MISRSKQTEPLVCSPTRHKAARASIHAFDKIAPAQSILLRLSPNRPYRPTVC